MKQTALVLTLTLLSLKGFSFCGFYVAKADAKLFNNSSQVIMVRDGDKTTITMANDYNGNAKDFALVVPVPVVLTESDIFVLKSPVFEKIDAYSAPRLVEYWDPSPCERIMYDMVKAVPMATESASMKKEDRDEKNNGVTIEAKYTVGEYDILILSALQSNGLKKWLIQNGYTIPASAEEVLEPYIKSNMKFFVVKVNLEEQKKSGSQNLRPIQISFHTEKFMLPIRLGMANSTGNQDLIIYAFSKKGRIECTNYRTVNMVSDKNVPEFMNQHFSKFYADAFTTKWNKENRNVLMLEYAWDLSARNYVKCDPCIAAVPNYNDLDDAGVNWSNDVYFTRLHVRYNRQDFPQDLVFEETPNRQNFQARYIMNHAAKDVTRDCPEANAYFTKVTERREEEVANLGSLAGWNTDDYAWYIYEYKSKTNNPRKIGAIKRDALGLFGFDENTPVSSGQISLIVIAASLFLFVLVVANSTRRRNKFNRLN